MKTSTRMMHVCLLLACIAAWSVAGPDFSGTWVRDTAKSDPMAMGRGGGGGTVNITMEIKQTANEFTITQNIDMGGTPRTTEQKFTLDGKQNTNPAGMGRGEMTSTSRWDGDQLVIEGKQTMSTQKGDFEITIKSVYALSADGKVLTVTTSRSTPQGERTTKQVYNSK